MKARGVCRGLFFLEARGRWMRVQHEGGEGHETGRSGLEGGGCGIVLSWKSCFDEDADAGGIGDGPVAFECVAAGVDVDGAVLVRGGLSCVRVAGVVGFGCAIGVHPLVGYIHPVHLGPACVGALGFLWGWGWWGGGCGGRWGNAD
jgi:hypothetical protein